MSFRWLILGTLLCLLPDRCGTAAFAQSRQEATVRAATSVLNEIMAVPAKRIPAFLLSGAEGVAIVPGVVKGGLVVGVRHGRGVLLTRNEDKSWKIPTFVVLTGGSVGWQVGVQSTDVILVFKTRNSIDGLMKGKLTIGADAAVAAGPVGRQAAAATDARLSAEIFSYSRSRGLFAGVSLEGSVLEVDHGANSAYYRASLPNIAAGGANPVVPESALQLVRTLLAYTTGTPGPLPVSVPAETAAGDAGPHSVSPQAGPRPGAVQPADLLRRKLAQASTQLQALLDANWQRYLALPAEVYGTAEHASLAALQDVASRLDQVASDPRYHALASRTEFIQVRRLLQDYLAVQRTTPHGTIPLPPPPSDGGTRDGAYDANLRLPQ
ncbi:MAG: Ysc84 actin-binding domain protein [Planctomycetales bacterium]|nr:Ysc84 actin-binding domain protein [Planctomycetales bacterium]NIM08438.1 Ysc84 actin-binding domain protein [Planctomycetales bacterium]NIN07914.1 Ysc84 actin-binding domain protein [Planctomycetales bacterium]NIN77044.1 Ysc84 actin-binding domain protein [Planctomycetales bacterium]NIO34229.1 Ysc84 actin-binding domain protein [Planctomycetales bacterium]